MDISNRAVYRGQITKLVKTATEYLQSPESRVIDNNVGNFDVVEEDLTVLLQRLTAARDNLNKGNNEVRSQIKPDDFEKECESVAEYEDKAIAVIARIQQRLTKLREVQGKTMMVNSGNETINDHKGDSVKLPRLTLKKFSGNYHEWLPFWEQYRSTVHENRQLNGTEKFHYLQSILIGKAAETIAGFTPSESCYDGAIALLVDEYGNTEKLVDRNMQTLMSIPSVSSRNDAIGLRRLYNSVVSCTRSLTALGVPSTHYYIMLKSILLKCMPSDLRVDFHRTYQNSTENECEAPTNDAESVAGSESSVGFEGDKQVKAILKFLKREVESLEKSAESKRAYNPTPMKINRTATELLTSSYRERLEECIFCKSTNHATPTCIEPFTLSQRKEILKRSGRCFRCTQRGHSSKFCNNKSIRCSDCNGRHARSMCDPNYKRKTSTPQTQSQINQNENTSHKTVSLCSGTQQSASVFLQTACAFISSTINSSKAAFIRLVIDGGAQRSYIKASISQRLNLLVVGTENIRILPFGGKSRTPIKKCNIVRIVLRSQYDSSRHIVIEAIEVEEICVDVLPVPPADSLEFAELVLADARIAGDPEDGINLLIGSDYYWQVVYDETLRIDTNLRAINTVFGWTLQGPAASNNNNVSALNATTSLHVCCFEKFEERKFWDLDSIGISAETCENSEYGKFYNYVYKRGERYEAKLLWKGNHLNLDNYREGALRRFNSLVKKLSREPAKLLRYDKAMREYILNGIAETFSNAEVSNPYIYYMAHHPIYREDKATTKQRIVFDASARTGNNASLNDCLLAGPNMLPDVLTVLLKFRIGEIGIIADVEKAFLQIALAEEDRNSHRFYWFKEPISSLNNLPSIQEYRMARVTFGVKCSPFLLGATIYNHIREVSADFPETSSILQQSFYMDDLVAGITDRSTALKLYKEANEIMGKVSMKLRKWNSNDSIVRDSFIENEVPHIQKVLGLLWYTSSDELAVDLCSIRNFLTTHYLGGTKRAVLQLIARIYDPLGVLGPSIIKLKILFQLIWRRKLDWDVGLPQELLKIFHNCLADFSHLKDMVLPRCVLGSRGIISVQLHIFADASLQAYGAVAYLRCLYEDGQIEVKYLCSRSRVAPLKEDGDKMLTLPRLELTAALIAARLKFYLEENLNSSHNLSVLWSDSKIALCWIHGGSKKWKPYILHRVKEIREKSELSNWRHCPGKDNPADLLTRGIDGKALVASSMWMNGPFWLKAVETHWPNDEIVLDTPAFLTCLIAVNEDSIHQLKEPILLIENYSRYRHLLRVTAYVLRFARLSKATGYLTATELHLAENYWIKHVQEHEYYEEISALVKKSKIKPSSSLLMLNPIIDELGILRVGSRIPKMGDTLISAYPIILPKSSHLTKLIVVEMHERVLHGGINLVFSRIRERFWIPRGRQLIKAVVKPCRVCKRIRGKPAAQPFAPLPKERLQASRPFETTGVDFAGPLYVRTSPSAERTSKVYIMLLTCAVVRAIHLELVSSLSTENCLLALRRFISRRGVPAVIISDNAATFKRASMELKYLGNILKSEELLGYASNQGITWKFIVERAPWWGGFWERLVRSVKEVLRVSIGKAVLNFEQLQTLLTEVEAVINCRPLTYISNDPLDLSPLTPQNILTGLNSTTIMSETNCVSDECIRQIWKSRLRMTNIFWKRWKLEYLHQLRSVHHHSGTSSSNLKIGDVVIVNDPATSRVLWKLAIIESIFPGRDGKVRACEVRFHTGAKLRRPVQLLYPLEVTEGQQPSYVGPEDVENSIDTH